MVDEGAGWIKLHRALLNGPIIQHAGLLQVWIYCLLRANREPKRVMFPGCLEPIPVERGEFVTGRNSLHAALYPATDKEAPVARTVWRWLESLQSMNCVTLRTVSNRCTVVSINNYKTYQARSVGQCPADVPPVSNPCPADVPPVSTDKNDNNQRIKEGIQENEPPAMQFVAPKAFCINPGVTAIDIQGELIEYHEDPLRWEAEFVRRWNLLPKALKRTSMSLDESLRRTLQDRLMDTTWFWQRAMAEFPLPVNSNWQPNLHWFLKPDSVSSILGGSFQRIVNNPIAKAKPDVDDEPVTFTEEELED